MAQTMKQQWFGNVRADMLSGIVVALALIPEALAFSIIAGVDPMVGLYASFCIAIVISFAGGRPGMISAATGAMALVMAPLVKDHGLQYMLAATILTGIIQVILGICRIDRLMRFIPRAVMIGFVNALAILIFMAQVPHFWGISSMTYVFVGITLLLLYTLPRWIKSVPAPLIAIVVLTVISIFGNVGLGTVGDLGNITQTLPTFLIPDIPFNMETLVIVLPYSLAMALIGLLESLLTSSILDEMTDTSSDKAREARGQGIANIINGFFGGMAGCAMIGQSVINVKSGGRGRLSTFVAGSFLMFMILVLGELVVQIPMPVLVGIMITVSVGTFDWSSFTYIRKAPITDSLVMVVTVIIVVATHDLSKGVIAGVLLSAVFFVAKISKIQISQVNEEHHAIIRVTGQLFFASSSSLVKSMNFNGDQSQITIDFTQAHIWDDSAVGAIDKVVAKYRENHKQVTLIGLNASSLQLLQTLATEPTHSVQSQHIA